MRNLLCSSKNLSMIPGATYVYLDDTDPLDLICCFFCNDMATFLSLVGKRAEGPLFRRR